MGLLPVTPPGVGTDNYAAENHPAFFTGGVDTPAAGRSVAHACLSLCDSSDARLDAGGRAGRLFDYVSRLVRALDMAACMTDDDGAFQVLSSTHDRVGALQRFELEICEGPTVDALRTGDVVHARLPDALARWPRYVPMALAIGYCWIHAFPLCTRSAVVGALVAGSGEDVALERREADMVALLAASAAVGVTNERAVQRFSLLTGQLEEALNSRVLIEQAKGAVAERLHMSPPNAFILLRRYSRRRGLPLRTVARAAVEGELGACDLLPPPSPRRRRFDVAEHRHLA